MEVSILNLKARYNLWKIVHGFYKSRKDQSKNEVDFQKERGSVHIRRNCKESDCDHCSGFHHHLLPRTLRGHIFCWIPSWLKSSITTRYWYPDSLMEPDVLRTNSLLPGLHSFNCDMYIDVIAALLHPAPEKFHILHTANSTQQFLIRALFNMDRL